MISRDARRSHIAPTGLSPAQRPLSTAWYERARTIGDVEIATATAQPDRLDWLQALRGLAAMGVLLTHGRLYFKGSPLGAEIDRLIVPLASGVDLFFVISGFIMVYATRQTTGGPRDMFGFWGRRLARIWPAYLVLTLVYFAYYTLLPGTLTSDALVRLGQSVLFVPPRLTRLTSAPVIPPGWTLTYEVLFYLAFGLALLAPRKARALWIAGGVLAILVVAPYLLGELTIVPHRAFRREAYSYFPCLRVILNPLMWEFVFGMLAAAIYLSPLTIPIRTIRMSLGVIASLLVIANIYHRHAHMNLRVGAGYAILVATLAICSKGETSLRTPKALVALGGISYTLYLVHMLLIEMVWAAIGTRHGLGLPLATVAFFTAISLSILIAWWLSPILEHRLLDSAGRPRRR